jgi:hypothetical protein
MKYGQIKSIIAEISQGILLDSEGNYLFDAYFPNPKTIDFLAKTVALGQNFTMVAHYPVICEFSFPPLRLHKKGKEWHLGYYAPHRKKHFSNFVHFFDCVKSFVPLYFLNEKKEVVFRQYPSKSEISGFLKNHITELNQDLQYDYEQDFIKVLLQFANTGIRLKIIVADCEGDFYVTYSQIWVYAVGKKYFLKFHNLRKNIRKPSEINNGEYLTIERKIVQINYRNRVLYSTDAFSESEMAWRKDYFLRLIEGYYAVSKS